MKKLKTIISIFTCLLIIPVMLTACGKKEELPEFSDETMFTLRIYQPWFYESLHYTLQSDGTLIVLYYDTELGRETLSDERMKKIKKIFSPEKVYKMNVGKED